MVNGTNPKDVAYVLNIALHILPGLLVPQKEGSENSDSRNWVEIGDLKVSGMISP